MNKYIIFALLFVFVLNGSDDNIYDGDDQKSCISITGNNANVKNCSAIKLDDDDYNCCYVTQKYKGKEDKYCLGVKKSKVKTIIDDAEEDEDVSDVSIDCSSNYISNALLILLSLLF